MGYSGTHTPAVIQRNVLENPGWYTAYTPYQAEIAQGRLEALLNFQTMVIDLTGLPIANASLLDEGTAAAEAVTMAHGIAGDGKDTVLVDAELPSADDRRRARARGGTGHDGRRRRIGEIRCQCRRLCGLLVQYPATDGAVRDHRALAATAHAAGALVIVATDLLALTLLTPPGEWGADVAVGNSQRFGVPLGYGGPARGVLRDEGRVQAPHARAASSASRATRTASRRCAWRSRRASSTSAARRRRATSAPRRCCSR